MVRRIGIGCSEFHQQVIGGHRHRADRQFLAAGSLPAFFAAFIIFSRTAAMFSAIILLPERKMIRKIQHYAQIFKHHFFGIVLLQPPPFRAEPSRVR